MSIRPIGDRILVRETQEEATTKSGIVLPDTVDKEKKAEGKIVAIGQGVEVQKLSLQVGQTVLFSKYAGDEIKADGEEFKIVKHDEILAVIE